MSAIVALVLAAAPLQARPGERSGEQVYKQMCASCHGAAGEGTKEHPDPLVGDRPVDRLARYIEKSMPEDKPGTCTGEDAKRVAAYIHDAFYSRAAQARNRPLRVELARLTARQYRNAVADLAGAVADPPPRDGRRGLLGEYFKGSRRFREEAVVLERLDPVLDFDFGEWSPAEGIYADEFSIRWTGSVFAPETGTYEFNLETVNGARLYVNDSVRPVVDGWVRSGTEKAHRESVFLLGGRVYPVRIEFYKAKQEKKASIGLKWKRPRRAEELVPAELLSPVRSPEVLVLRTPFPPEDRSMGYERAVSVSKEWDEAATAAALEVAGRLAADPKLRDRDAIRRLAERAFRRPLGDAERAFFVERPLASSRDAEAATKTALLLILKSPRFLYPAVGGSGADASDVASRISFGLWDSIPDAALLEAARAGRLDAPEGVAREIERMLPNFRTRAKLRDFLHDWLHVDRFEDITKDAKRFPEFSDAVEADLRTSLDLFLDAVVWSEASDFRELLLSNSAWLNGRLARVYGAELPADAPFRKVELDPKTHVGILTHPLLMAGFSYDATTSPIHRGLFVARSLLGRRLRPPPEAVTPLSPDLHPSLTTRERISLQTKEQACMSCHGMINPLGFALEHYDPLGRFRATEKGRPIDAKGSYAPLAGDAVRFDGARELGEFLARSEETHAAFVEHLFHFFIQQPVRAFGPDRPEILRKYFVDNGFSLRKLLAQAVLTSARVGEKGKAR
jgi:cytochrome c553